MAKKKKQQPSAPSFPEELFLTEAAVNDDFYEDGFVEVAMSAEKIPATSTPSFVAVYRRVGVARVHTETVWSDHELA